MASAWALCILQGVVIRAKQLISSGELSLTVTSLSEAHLLHLDHFEHEPSSPTAIRALLPPV